MIVEDEIYDEFRERRSDADRGRSPGRLGWVLPLPTLVELDEARSSLATEEVLAPASTLMRVGSQGEAVTRANGVRYGLAGTVFTNDLEKALGVADRLEAGLIKINGSTAGVDYHAPFGGIKGSGIDPKEQGLAARDFYTDSRTILLSP